MLVLLGSGKLPDTGRMETKPNSSCLVKPVAFTCSCRPCLVILTSHTSPILPLPLLLHPANGNHHFSSVAKIVAERRPSLELMKLPNIWLNKLQQNLLKITLKKKHMQLKSFQNLKRTMWVIRIKACKQQFHSSVTNASLRVSLTKDKN